MNYIRPQKTIFLRKLLISCLILVIVGLGMFFFIKKKDKDSNRSVEDVYSNEKAKNQFYDDEQITEGKIDIFWDWKGGEYLMVQGNEISSGWERSDQSLVQNGVAVESSLFSPTTEAYLVDIDGDVFTDFIVYHYSKSNLSREVWIFSDRNSADLISPLIDKNGKQLTVHEMRNLSPSEVFNPLKVSFEGYGIWLRDLDGDNVLEVITLDQSSPSEFSVEPVAKFIKKIYALSDNMYKLKTESSITYDSKEYEEIKNWTQIQGRESEIESSR